MKFNPVRWRKTFENVLRANRTARRAWDELVNAGITPEWLVYALSFSCDFEGAPGRSAVASLRERMALKSVRFPRQFLKQIQKDRDTLANVFHESGELIDLLDQFISRLHFLIEARKFVGSARVLNANLYVALLGAAVRARTGRRHYSELSALLDAAYETFGIERERGGAEAIRKTVSRFESRLPELAAWASEPDKEPYLGLLVMLPATEFAKTIGCAPGDLNSLLPAIFPFKRTRNSL